MKSLVAAVPTLAWALALAAPALPTRFPSAPPPPDLRQALEQYHPGSGSTSTSTAPRQLTPAERAELRRQLSEYGQPAPQPHRRR